jgi:hypothetical protein
VHQVNKINIKSAQAKEDFVIVKRAVKGKIRMELRICEIDKGGAAKVTKNMKLAPSASSGTRFESDEGWPFGKLITRFSLSRQ